MASKIGAAVVTGGPRTNSSLQESMTNLVSAQATAGNSTVGGEDNAIRYDSQAFAIAAYVLTGIGVAVCVGSAFFLHRFRKHQIISAGQPPFLYLICFGSLLLCASVSLSTIDQSNGHTTQGSLDASCIAWVWMTYIGQLIIYMALVCKLWRVQKVSRNLCRRVSIGAKQVIWPLIAVVSMAIATLLGWTLVSPPYYTTETVENPLDGSLYTVGTCYYDDGGISQLVLTILFVFSIGAVFWFSLKTRDLPETLSDSKRITQALLSHLVLGALLFAANIVLVLKLHSEGYQSQGKDESLLRLIIFLSNVFYQFIVAMLSLGFLVIPKIYYVRYEKVNGRLPSGVYKLAGRVTVTINGVPLRGPSSIPRFQSSTLSTIQTKSKTKIRKHEETGRNGQKCSNSSKPLINSAKPNHLKADSEIHPNEPKKGSGCDNRGQEHSLAPVMEPKDTEDQVQNENDV